ncbi:MAG: hypothetical protein VW258_03595, partial [Thalassolituus sp.]
MTGAWFGRSASDQQTRIRKLSIRAPEAQQQQLQRDISLADWPEVNDQRVVFIRRIHATAPAHQIASELKEQTRSLISYGNSDNVRIFDNSVEMLAGLLSDAAQGQIATKWYWKKWHSLSNQTPASAIIQIAGDFSDSVTGAISMLVHSNKSNNKASALFSALHESEAAYLLAMLCHELGYPAPSSPVSAARDKADRSVSTAFKTASAIQLPDNTLLNWRAVFDSLPDKGNSLTPHIQLAAWIIAKQYLPLMLTQEPDLAVGLVAQQLRTGTEAMHSNSGPYDGNRHHRNNSPLAEQKQSTTTPINTNSASEDNTPLVASNMSEVLHSVKTLGTDVLATTDSAAPHSRTETALETTAA